MTKLITIIAMFVASLISAQTQFEQGIRKAYKIAPENPRVVFQKASFEIGLAQYFGQDTKPMCAQIEKSIELFATFKPESALHPSWGLDRAQEEVKACK